MNKMKERPLKCVWIFDIPSYDAKVMMIVGGSKLSVGRTRTKSFSSLTPSLVRGY